MKNKTLKELLMSKSSSMDGLFSDNVECRILNLDYLEYLHGGAKEYSECTTHSGSCSELTSCGTYGSDCNSKCGLKFSETSL